MARSRSGAGGTGEGLRFEPASRRLKGGGDALRGKSAPDPAARRIFEELVGESKVGLGDRFRTLSSRESGDLEKGIDPLALKCEHARGFT